MIPTTIRACVLLSVAGILALSTQAPGQLGSFTGARPGGLGGSSNLGGTPAPAGGGIVGGPGMGGPGFQGTSKTYHCPRCKIEVGRRIQPPVASPCCGEPLANGEGLPNAPTPSPEPVAPSAEPLPALPSVPVVAVSEPAPESGVSVALGVGILLLGVAVLGVVAFLALRTKRRAPRRRRRVHGYD